MKKNLLKIIISVVAIFIIGTFYVSLKKTEIYDTKNLVGTNLDNFELNSLNKNLKINQELVKNSQYTLINFWASWCAPCRRENPNIVSAYKKHKDTRFKEGNGFEIFSVSLDKSAESWIKAINQDELFWKYHVSDLGGWNSEGAKIYNIRSIPSNVLINSKGIIIAKNLKGPALHRFLENQKK